MSNRPATTAAPNTRLIIGVVIGVLVLAVVAVFATAGGDNDDNSTPDPDAPSEYGIITVDGQALASATDDAGDPAVGTTAPTVISERSNEQIRLEPGESGRPTMIAFLAHWCPHCRRELPILVDLADAGTFDGMDTFAVLTSTTPARDNYPPSAWLDTAGWTGERLFDDEQSTVAAAYGLSSFPMLVFLDADGHVVARLSGEQPPAAIETAVEESTR